MLTIIDLGVIIRVVYLCTLMESKRFTAFSERGAHIDADFIDYKIPLQLNKLRQSRLTLTREVIRLYGISPCHEGCVIGFLRYSLRMRANSVQYVTKQRKRADNIF